ncbi:MAG: sulfite exporter TauE/SafE family protein [Flavobacteriales bacterium Tduv]
METLIIGTAFLLGFSGSLHCFGMCGPIAFTIAVDRNNHLKRLFQNITYQLGRVISYTSLGLFFGIIGYGFSLAGFHKILSILLGLGMMASVFFSKKKLNKIKPLRSYTFWLGRVQSALGGFIRKKNFSALFITGFLNGLLPCGLVYASVNAAMSMGNIFSSGLFMLYFGMGTVPLMFITVIMGNFISLRIRNKILRVAPVIVFFVGFLLIFRSLGLGIPYISPVNEVLHPEEEGQEKILGRKLTPSYRCH